MSTDHPSDKLGRHLRDLRISVTDRCNLRCTYCMPAEVFDENYQYLPKSNILSFEEITRLSHIFVGLGVEKLRITGGEPLLRRDLPDLIAMLAAIDGVQDIALTTNGILLPKLAPALKEAGLSRLTVSLDAISDDVFGAINGRGVGTAPVLAGIEAAKDAGFEGIKINMVVQKGVNDHEVLPMAEAFRESGHIVRFIEFMDVGNTNGWALERVVPAAEIVKRISEKHPLEAVAPNYAGEVASRFRYAGSEQEVGVISSVTAPFCAGCTRARISARGELFTCLFGSQGYDLREPLRDGMSDEQLAAFVSNIWRTRDDRYSEIRSSATGELPPKVEMSYIGG